MGEIHPLVLANYELEKPLTFLQVKTVPFTSRGFVMGHCQDLPRFPGAARDMALIGRADIPGGDIMAEILKVGGPYLQSVELFDIYAEYHSRGPPQHGLCP